MLLHLLVLVWLNNAVTFAGTILANWFQFYHYGTAAYTNANENSTLNMITIAKD